MAISLRYAGAAGPMIRVETKRSIWTLTLNRWLWRPMVMHQPDCSGVYGWLCFAVDWFSKEWLDFCEDHGGGLGTTMQWLEEDLNDENNLSNERC